LIKFSFSLFPIRFFLFSFFVDIEHNFIREKQHHRFSAANRFTNILYEKNSRTSVNLNTKDNQINQTKPTKGLRNNFKKIIKSKNQDDFSPMIV
jgi:pantothenate kinase